MMTVEEKRQANKERYYWLKEHHICACCGQQNARPGRVLCWDCADKQAEYFAKRYSYLKEDENYKRKRAERFKARYEKLKAARICTRCGKRPARTGRNLCDRCAAKEKSKYQCCWPPRAERVSYGLCYICGKPLKPNFKLCPACYEKNLAVWRRIHANPSLAMIAQRKKFKEGIHSAFVSVAYRLRKTTYQER
jgi:predicted amidophosphoribosyltransferase